MNKKIYKTIIVGAGISGLGCAHRLIEENSSFKIISPEVGGRITESKNHQVEYGAYYVMNDYLNTLSFVEKGKKIKPTDLVFFKSQKAYKVFDKKLLYHLPQFLKLVLLLREFKKHYQRFKIKCLRQNQVSCLKDDAYLWRLYNLRADVFVKENKLEKIVYDYLAEIIHGTAFLSIKDLNAFEFLHFSLPVIVSTHQFVFQSQKAEALIKKFWLKDKVLEVRHHQQSWWLNEQDCHNGSRYALVDFK
jgi:hypothetical protein